ncbi:MAG: SDR family NAD(P)-dependent oxidoreductase [Spirochaetaceae bacterium]|nr:SDR family NAD(P)-dependent oxidoreductase [Spirochaetaceae bacterium]
MSDLNSPLTGKTALVTGGGGGLGRAFCVELARQGARVAVLSRRKESAEKGVKAVLDAGGNALALTADVTNTSEVEQARDELESVWGPVNVLVNAAGGHQIGAVTALTHWDASPPPTSGPATFFDLDDGALRAVSDLNFMGTVIPTRIFGRSMAAAGGGTVVNISSMSADRPMTKGMGYAAAKASVDNFTRWLAVHLAPANIRVNAIAPGFFLTDQNRPLLIAEDGGWTERANRILDHIPQGRLGEPEELNGALAWLVNDEAARYVTGTVVCVDGGFSAYKGV